MTSDKQATPQDDLPGAVKAVQVNEWVTNNRDYLTGPNRGTLQEAAAKASDALLFRVPASMLTTLMQANGIETKRVSKAKAKEYALMADNELLRAENAALRRTLGKFWVSEQVPGDMKDFIFAGLDDEILTAIKNRD